MERTANKDQQAAINARNKLITVSAGAGTGKTWTLASRYASLLTDRNCGCNLENIITLTFTEKAAQEMKDRIEKVIMERISSATEDEQIALRRALSRFDDAHISTIHSFASGVLRESAVELGLDPASSIISQPEADELIEELGRVIEELDETITKHFKNTDSLEKILSKWLPQDIAVLSSECEEIHSASSRSFKEFLDMSNDSAMVNVIEDVKKTSTPKIKLACEKWRSVLYELKEQIYSEYKGRTPDYVTNFRAFIEKWGEIKIENDDEYICFFIDLMESLLKRASFGKVSESLNSCLGEPAKEWKKRHIDLLMISRNLSIDRIKSNYPEDLNEREALIQLCSVCWSITESKRRENNILSFTDLIKLCSKALSSKNYKRNYTQIMIDEFQDTDPLQEKMIRQVAGNKPDVSIFVVGDPKQSIYRFRNADLRIFESYVKESNAKRNNDENGVYIKMNGSFRARSGLCNRINGLFNFIWPRNLGETISNLKYENLSGDADKIRDAGTLPIMAMLTENHIKRKNSNVSNRGSENEDNSENTSVADDREGRVKIDETRERLLNKLTESLIHWKMGGLTIWDSDEKRIRPFEWRDCAILTPTRASWTLIEDAFSKAGIPLSIEGNVSWFIRGEVLDIINMLRAVAFPDDELSNAGWRNSFLSPRDENAEEFLRRTAKIKGGSAVLNYYLDNLYWLLNIPFSQRLRALANMCYARQLAEDYERLICANINGCSEWLLKALKSKSRFEEPRINDDGKSAKLLTIHASKGLEFPFVIIYGTERPPKVKRMSNSLCASKHLGLFASKHVLFGAFHYALEEQAEAEEYQRLLYVATTRAKDSVLFCGITDENGKAEEESWLEYLMNWNANSNDRNIVSIDHVNKKTTVSLFTEMEKMSQSENQNSNNIEKLALPEPEVSLTRISATSYALYEWCPRAWRRKYRQGVDIDFENIGDADRDSLSGKDIGSLTHWILSKWDFSVDDLNNYFGDEKLIENVVRLLPPSLRASYKNRSNREKISKWLLGFANSEIGEQFRKLCSENKLQREVPFKVFTANGIKLIGTFDVFWEDVNGVHLRDWKTNPNDRVLEIYKNQLFFYAYALDRLKGNLSTIGLVSIKDCKSLNIANTETLDKIEEKIISAVKKAAVSQWERVTENCPICPWRTLE